MNHEMKLHNEPFEAIKNGTKTVELRLNDVKRRALKVGDTITFTNRLNNDKLDVKIKALVKFDDFNEAFNNYSLESIGVPEGSTYELMNTYYNEEEIKKYHALAIEIELL